MIQDLNISADALVRFSSDLHLGHPRSKIQHIDEIRPLLEGVQHLILCGDTAELRPCLCFEASKKMFAQFEELCEQEKVNLHILAGNHDPIHPVSCLRLHGGKVVAMHGHAIYKEIGRWGREYSQNKQACRDLISQFPEADHSLSARLQLAKEMAELIPQPTNPSISRLPKIIQKIHHITWPPSRPLAILEAWISMERRCHSFADAFFPEAELFCLGHFHRRMASLNAPRKIINTGALFQNANAYVVDLLGNHVNIRPVSKSQTGIHIGEAIKSFTLSTL